MYGMYGMYGLDGMYGMDGLGKNARELALLTVRADCDDVVRPFYGRGASTQFVDTYECRVGEGQGKEVPFGDREGRAQKHAHQQRSPGRGGPGSVETSTTSGLLISDGDQPIRSARSSPFDQPPIRRINRVKRLNGPSGHPSSIGEVIRPVRNQRRE